MSEPRRITSEDLALFAMQLLPPEEMAEVAAYVEQSEDARRELAEIQGDLAAYAHTVEMQSPSAQARERWTPEQAKSWSQHQPWVTGGNFLPSNAINQLEMWQPETAELLREWNSKP